ncbi:MAG: tRNA (adenosine(37)-N6)-threonylcarbamoyltransferase complex dimerization subunit type 1 TsaB [Pseudomonadota bacterium]
MTRQRLMAIETTADVATLALTDGETVWHEAVTTPGAHAADLMQRVNHLFASSALEPRELDGIVYGQGPGSFTGVRIGIALAQGLAHAANLPMQGICSLRNRAAQLTTVTASAVTIAIDARMGEYYVARFSAGDWQPLAPPALAGVEGFVPPPGDALAGNALCVDVTLAQRSRAGGAQVITEGLEPDARTALRLVAQRWHPPEAATASYVRDKVADKPGERSSKPQVL